MPSIAESIAIAAVTRDPRQGVPDGYEWAQGKAEDAFDYLLEECEDLATARSHLTSDAVIPGAHETSTKVVFEDGSALVFREEAGEVDLALDPEDLRCHCSDGFDRHLCDLVDTAHGPRHLADLAYGMDDDLREQLHAEAIEYPQDFFDAYARAYEEKHGETWAWADAGKAV